MSLLLCCACVKSFEHYLTPFLLSCFVNRLMQFCQLTDVVLASWLVVFVNCLMMFLPTDQWSLTTVWCFCQLTNDLCQLFDDVFANWPAVFVNCDVFANWPVIFVKCLMFLPTDWCVVFVTSDRNVRQVSDEIFISWLTSGWWISSSEDAPLLEFMYLVFTRMPGESYRRRLRSLLFVLV